MIAIYTYYYNRTGRRHRSRGEKSQDTAVTGENENFEAFALCDGVSACAQGGTGARLTAVTALSFLLRLGADAQTFPPEKIASVIMEEVQYKLRSQANSDGRPLSDYASTLALCMVDKSSEPTVQVCLLGDSGALLCSEFGCSFLPPRQRTPCQTTTRSAASAMDIHAQKLKPGEHLCLCSDGFLDLFKNPRWNGPLKQALCAGDPPSLRHLVDNADPEDDCTFLLILPEPPEGRL